MRVGWGNLERVWHIALGHAMGVGRGPQAFTAITAVGGEAPHLSDNYEPMVIK